MGQFEKLLEYVKGLNKNTSEQGTWFENFMKYVFLTSPVYQELYEKVWTWTEFPYNGGRHDFGIDLVAKIRDMEEYVAIQCKFYDEEYSVSKSDVDTFLTASGKPFYIKGVPVRYSGRIIVSTTDRWTSTANDIIEGQIPAVTRIRLKDLKEIGIGWDSVSLENPASMRQSDKKIVRPHQKEAIAKVLEGFETADRGKLIMACGTGKTFTALKIVEAITQGNGNVLFLVPSISLLNQTLLEWTKECIYNYQVYAICSDPKVTKSKAETVDTLADTIVPATTDVESLVEGYTNLWNASEKKTLRFFFSTYQSIDVISEFQKITGLEFDITVCDEAHRTTGVTLAGEDESSFVKVHNNDIIRTKKRLYMTATPRIYADESKQKAANNSALLCSMDDEAVYGKDFYVLGFADSVSMGLLSDYKVIVLAVDEGYVSKTLQNLLTNSDSELTLDDSVKILGCLNGLSKKTLFDNEQDYFENDPYKMKRAVAFCSDIKSSKKFVQLFGEIQDEIKLYGADQDLVTVELQHVDGTQNALYRKECIDWLKEDTSENVCRILSNARCLSEGIDVPALDAVMFLNPKNSIVDIIQSVGRVMRKAEGKNFGYIILPIGIPAGVEPEEALGDNKKYKIVWDVLQALRAHDDRFNNTINKIELNRKKPANIQIIGVTGKGEGTDNETQEKYSQLTMKFDELQKWKESLYAKIVKKCGTRKYWETWAKDIADIANRHIAEIELLIERPEISGKFSEFLSALQSNLNSSIEKDDAIEMLAEHMITKPVFDALFDNYEFIKSNPVSIIMQDMLDVLDEKALDKEQETLNKFYLSVQERAKGIDNSEGKQKIVIELYEQFFKNALPKQVAKLGIVYTPIQVVNFILKSVEYVLQERFGTSISEKGVHILDPFTGTGTFIVQLLRSGIIKKEDLLYKYCNEIHANEIVLLAYYIAAVNIEETFHDIMDATEYIPFEGIVLTDTFALSENIDEESGEVLSRDSLLFHQNSERATKQLETDITVIVGNPPYSVGQKSGNDNNQNVAYNHLDKALASTYVAKSNATLSRNAYDTYIKAFRWATDRIGDNGVVGFVSNGAYIDGVALDGFRQCLLEDFNSIYVFNLRGNQRTSGELSRKEGGKIFGSGSRTPVAITILVKKKGIKKDGYIRYFDIGDYLSRSEKLSKIDQLESIKNISWNYLYPNANNDWLNQRNPNFMNYLVLGDKKRREKVSIYSDNYASGLSTNRDIWVYNFSSDKVKENSDRMIAFYNEERERCHQKFNESVAQGICLPDDSKARETYLQNVRSNDENKISWSRGLFNRFCKDEQITPTDNVRTVLYRPFCKKNLIYNPSIIEMPSKWDSIYPENDTENMVICVSGAPIKKGFSVMMSDCIQDLNLMEHSLCMPLYMYDKVNDADDELTLFDFLDKKVETKPKYKRRYAISDNALKKFQETYGSKVTKESIFYYIYAVLQSKEYISMYEDNLSKEMPRIPMLDKFMDYVKIGKELADLHIHYEKIIDSEKTGIVVETKKPEYSVMKMRFRKVGKQVYKDTIVYNDYITIHNIPEKAYQYVINGKSAIEWIMERYAVTVDKASGIVEDPNKYQGSKYIFDLLISVIYVSIKTQELIDSMPEYKEI